MAATLLVAAALALQLTRNHLEGAIDDRLAAAADSFRRGPAQRVGAADDLARETRRWLAAYPLADGETVAVRTSGGGVLTSAGGRLELGHVRGVGDLLTASETRWWSTSSEDEGPVRALTVPLRLGERTVGTLVLLAYEERVEDALAGLLSGIAWASAIGLVFAVLLGVVVVRGNLRPLRRIASEVDSIETTGDLSRRVARDGAVDEVGRLAAAFDRMLGRLQESFESQRRLLADASHELRTPLTVARGQLELLEQEVDGADDRRSLAVATDELDRMARIVDDLLLLARLDEGMPLAREPVEVELVLREALLRAMLIDQRDATVDAEAGLYALADPDRLLQVVTNLVRNAVEHTDEAARISLRTARDDDRVAIEVADTGAGIPPDELPHVFERLYRGSAARGSSGGAGLGLAIAASLTEAMEGELDVRSSVGEGTTFVVRLPAADT